MWVLMAGHLKSEGKKKSEGREGKLFAEGLLLRLHLKVFFLS